MRNWSQWNLAYTELVISTLLQTAAAFSDQQSTEHYRPT